MSHAKVTKQKGAEGTLEFMKKSGAWDEDPKKAYVVSEEDAKVFVRTLSLTAKHRRKNYHYDYVVVDHG